jgi:hypothetical protein
VGGLLPLRRLVENASSYFEGEITGDQLTKSVRSIFAAAIQDLHADVESPTTCRAEILACAKDAMLQSGLAYFTISDIVSRMKARGGKYADSTIRTHITSRMCINAPDHHATVYPDLERTDRGTYRLIES